MFTRTEKSLFITNLRDSKHILSQLFKQICTLMAPLNEKLDLEASRDTWKTLLSWNFCPGIK